MSIEGTIFGKALDWLWLVAVGVVGVLWKRQDKLSERSEQHSSKLDVLTERLDNLPTSVDIDEAKSTIMQQIADSDIRSQGYRDGNQVVLVAIREDIATIKATINRDTQLADAIARAIAERPARKARSQ